MRTKFRIIVLLSLFFSVLKSGAQSEKNLSELVTPSAPAFSILGIQPGDIARPKSFAALEGTILSSFTNSSGFIMPRNYALEFSPYWFQSHPTLSFDQYVNPTMGQSLLQNLSVSLATTVAKDQVDTGKNYSRTGFGFRTQIFSGKAVDYMENVMMASQLLQHKQDALIALLGMMLNIRAQNLNNSEQLKLAIDAEFKEVLKSIQDTSTRNALKRFKEQRIDAVLNNFKAANTREVGTGIDSILIKNIEDATQEENFLKTVKNLSDKIKEKYGFFLEINGALALDFPTNQIGYSKVPKWGVWIIPSYRLKNLHFEFLGILRYIGTHDTAQVNHNIDIGAKIVFQKKKFSINAEGIYRYQSALISKTTEGDIVTKSTRITSDYRLDISFEYKITEMISVNYTLGKNFDDPVNGPGNLISCVGLNFGLNGLKIPVLPKLP